MKKKELLKQLNILEQKIQPDKIWKEKDREILHSQIMAQTSESAARVLARKISNKLIISILKPVSATLFILVAITSIWTIGVGATRNSLPGDLLYGLKLTGERLQVNLTLNDEKKTNLEMAFAGLRLDEVKQVMSTTKDKSNMEVSLKKFQENMTNVKSNLAKLEMTDKSRAVQLADSVDEKTQVYVDILKNDDMNSNQGTAEAIIVSQATADKALSVLLQEFETGSGNVSLNDIKAKVNSRIVGLKKDNETAKANIQTILANKAKADAEAKAKAEEDLKANEQAAKDAAAKSAETKPAENPATNVNSATNVNNDSGTATATNVNSATNAAPTDNSLNSNINSDQSIDQEPTPPAEQLPTIDEIKDKPDQVDKLLAKAQDYLNSNSVSQAFEQVGEADNILNLVNKVINANSQYLVAPSTSQDAGKTDQPAAKTDTKVSI